MHRNMETAPGVYTYFRRARIALPRQRRHRRTTNLPGNGHSRVWNLYRTGLISRGDFKLYSGRVLCHFATTAPFAAQLWRLERKTRLVCVYGRARM